MGRAVKVYPRISKWLGIAIFGAAANCSIFAAERGNTPKPNAVDADRYADFMAGEVLDVHDLAEGAEIQRRFFNRITPPEVSLIQPMFPSVAPFDAANFTDSFLEELLGEDKNSVAIYPLSLVLNPKTRETLVYNADGKLIATLPAGPVSRVWTADADPARVTLQLDLLPSEHVEPYLYVEDRIKETEATLVSKSAKLPRPGGIALKSLGVGQFGFTGIQQTNGSMQITVSNGMDGAEIYSYTVLYTASVVIATWTNDENVVVTDTNIVWDPVSPWYDGIESGWECRTTNLFFTNDIASWMDSDIPSNALVRFYAAAQPLDTDEDGLTGGAEILLHRTDPGLADTDGDGLSDGGEVNGYGTNPLVVDSDDDGIDDASEISWGTNPTNQIPSYGVNKNWLYLNSCDKNSAQWELVPGLWQRFLMINEATGTGTVHVLVPRNLVLGTGETAVVEARLSWQNAITYEWTNTWRSGACYTSVVVSASNRFHGLPTMASTTLDVYRVVWELPTNSIAGIIYYSVCIKSLDAQYQQTDYLYLVNNLIEGDEAQGYGVNNWLNEPQWVGPTFSERDYALNYSPSALKNGDFCEGNSAELTNQPNWLVWGTNAGISTNIAIEQGGRSFYSRGWDGMIYQNFAVAPGSETVLSGYMLAPSATNQYDPSPLTGSKRGKVALEYYDKNGDSLSSAEAFISSNSASDAWHYFAITSLVPDHAWSANVSLRADLTGSGNAYFDGLQTAVSDDTDNDGLPDWWEQAQMLNSNSPLDSIKDADADGCMNIQEYRSGLNPHSEDTDGDGMPDSWELQNGFDPQGPMDASLDFDADGLSNLEEYLLNYDPTLADTDRDGLDDAFEYYDYGSDPLTSNSWSYSLLQTIPGSNTVDQLGNWVVDGSEIYSISRRGYLEYPLIVESGDVGRLEISGSDNNNYFPSNRFILRLSIDGEYIGKLLLNSKPLENTTVSCFLPWLSAGSHTIRIYWDNASEYESLRIQELRWLSLEGADADEDGVKDWVESRLRRQCSIVAPSASLTSPAFMEGEGPYIGMMSLSGGLTPKHGIGDGWYANVPLNSTSAIAVVCSFQNGGMVETNQIQWAVMNLLAASNLLIRSGDSLLLTAVPEGAESGAVHIEVGGDTNYVTDIDTPVIHCFETTGTYCVTGTYYPTSGVSQSASVTVTVVSASFDSSPACWVGYPRMWACPNLSTSVFVESDADIVAAEMVPSLPGERRFQLEMFDNEERYMAARLFEGGPILDSVAVRGFHVLSEQQTYLRVEETYPDRSQLIGTVVVASPLLADLDFHAEIYVSGVFFADYSLEQSFASGDFNELGEYPMQFIREADTQTSVCHRLRAFQDGVELGSR